MPAPTHEGKTIASVACAVLTVSDSRTVETDVSGRLMQELLTGVGHRICRYEIVPDEPDRVRALVAEASRSEECDAILLNGGTGLSARDTTYEAVAGLLDKRLDGFGELFRQLSYDDIGPAAMLSRAVAGIVGRTAVFSMPGSPAAVRLAMEKLILPELGHVVFLLRG